MWSESKSESIPIELDPVERVSLLDADHIRLTKRLAQLDEAIDGLEHLDSLKPDAVAVLEKYRENEFRTRSERAEIERETGRLLSEEPEAAREWERLHAVSGVDADGTP